MGALPWHLRLQVEGKEAATALLWVTGPSQVHLPSRVNLLTRRVMHKGGGRALSHHVRLGLSKTSHAHTAFFKKHKWKLTVHTVGYFAFSLSMLRC